MCSILESSSTNREEFTSGYTITPTQEKAKLVPTKKKQKQKQKVIVKDKKIKRKIKWLASSSASPSSYTPKLKSGKG